MTQQADQPESDQQELVKQRMECHGEVAFSRQDKETILPHSSALE
jgi:hypothetical protein